MRNETSGANKECSKECVNDCWFDLFRKAIYESARTDVEHFPKRVVENRGLLGIAKREINDENLVLSIREMNLSARILTANLIVSGARILAEEEYECTTALNERYDP